MRAPFFAPSTAVKELGRLFNQISVYREQHRARSWQANQGLMFRAQICALAVILIATAGGRFRCAAETNQAAHTPAR